MGLWKSSQRAENVIVNCFLAKVSGPRSGKILHSLLHFKDSRTIDTLWQRLSEQTLPGTGSRLTTRAV